MDKPFKTIEEQIEILQSRGLETNDEAPIILEREGYYSVVNGYKDIFIDKEAKSAASGEDRFVKGASFDDIYRLFRFDRDLRMLLFANLAIAEATLKTIEAYQFGKYHQNETEAYLKAESYRSDRAFSDHISDFIGELKKMVGKSGRPNFKRDYIEHYYRNHDGVPIWVRIRLSSDHGSQYRSLLLGKTMKEHNIVPSMGSISSPWDNAPTESLMGIIKRECVHRRTFATKEEAQLEIFEYIETFYNRRRIHSALGYRSPMEFEEEMLKNKDGNKAVSAA